MDLAKVINRYSPIDLEEESSDNLGMVFREYKNVPVEIVYPSPDKGKCQKEVVKDRRWASSTLTRWSREHINK